MEEIKVLVTTDNHLGYLERDPIRGEDSFRAFEEVFDHANRLQVDCVLICGDLFHEANPSKYTMLRAIEILKKHCIGNRPVEIECISNKSFKGTQGKEHITNYYSENINIGLPVFSIHGNHDEPSGYKGVSSLDIFAELQLINYFGSIDSMGQKIEVSPFVLKKGEATVNIYGLGALRDERMSKLFAERKIEMKEGEKGPNILVVHQTRCSAGLTSYLPEKLISKKMDLVIWGHMHESLPVPVQNIGMGFYTVQPGSTVQTSLCASEAKGKHCVLLRILPGEWKTETIPMVSPRELIVKNISSDVQDVEEHIKQEMRKILAECSGVRRPLIRLRMEINNGEKKSLITRRILEEFKEKVANPKEVLRVISRRRQQIDHKAVPLKEDKTRFCVDVEDVRVLPKDLFSQAILECIEREDKSLIGKRYDEITKNIEAVLKAHRWTEIDQELGPAVEAVNRKLLYIQKDENFSMLPRHSIEIAAEHPSFPDKDKKNDSSLLDFLPEEMGINTPGAMESSKLSSEPTKKLDENEPTKETDPFYTNLKHSGQKEPKNNSDYAFDHLWE
ncbi:double-strand break repair protein MRE11 [Nematocida sp. LUAm3]|nr:double-strand break repair protein MRE11 [Nematocida sp. LUAm3]KAI5176051.1 double-strand break repair protein MRE11 [Nematocida sp. LUAm2]KAI5177095.1 double-strand break repair protein MRE11 [Nematocida sp. LUAm1]